VSSYVVVDGMAGDFYVFRPGILLLDGDFSVVRTVEPNAFEWKPARSSESHGPPGPLQPWVGGCLYKLEVALAATTTQERFLVVLTDDPVPGWTGAVSVSTGAPVPVPPDVLGGVPLFVSLGSRDVSVRSLPMGTLRVNVGKRLVER
jgi:hypothetical protein